MFLANVKLLNNLKIFKQLITLLILLYLCVRIIKYITYTQGFTNESDFFISYEDAMKILEKDKMKNNATLNQIIQSKLDSFTNLDLWHNELLKIDMPKIIHFIWIGSTLSDKYIENITTYIHNNPRYEIWIWHDDNTIPMQKLIKKYNQRCKMQNINQIQFFNKFGIDKIVKWAGKADVMRYEIIYKYGGMYIDVDSRSIKPFDDNNNFNHSFVCIDSSGIYNNLTNAQFGFTKNNLFMGFVIMCLQENIKCHYDMNANKNMDDILSISGPPFFTTCFYLWIKKHPNYPINCINQRFTIQNNEFSYNYHTNDKNW